jgi:arsenate reductase
VTERVPAVLFLCTHNAGRSQMAMGFARRLGGDRVIGIEAKRSTRD